MNKGSSIYSQATAEINSGGWQKETYGKRTSSFFEAVVAGKYQYAMQTTQGLLMPSIKVGVAFASRIKSNDLKFKLKSGEDAKFSIRGNNKKQTRFFANPEIMVKNDNFDFALSYTLEQAKKFTGHMFGLKIMSKF